MLKTSLLAVAVLGAGCFTTAGAVGGGAIAASKLERGEDTTYAASVTAGALLGLVVDAVAIYAITSSIDTSSEPWDWGCYAYCGH